MSTVHPSTTRLTKTEYEKEHLDTQTVEYYGAVGDGATDDTAAIQDAIDAAYESAVGTPGQWFRANLAIRSSSLSPPRRGKKSS